MEIINSFQPDLKALGKLTSCNVYCIHVKIKDVNNRAEQMIKLVSDTSWIESLGAIQRVTFEANVNKTVTKLVNDIFSRVDSTVTSEFGEYLISDTAGLALQDVYTHLKIPLSELWKSKLTGNDGFDFHTESLTNLICYGEAKYKASANPYVDALNQISDFINHKKDDSDLIFLENFCSKKGINNYVVNKRKAFVAAFSLNAKKPDLIFKNILKGTEIDCLLAFPELYLIGVEV